MSASIQTGVPTSFNLPGTYVDAYPVGGTSGNAFVVLMIGDVGTTAPTGVTFDSLMLGGTAQAVSQQLGASSTLATMYAAYRAVDPITTVWLMPIATPSSGGEPDLTDALAAVGDLAITVLATPYSDTISLGLIDTWLGTRWLPTDFQGGVHLTVRADTVQNLTTYGAGCNSQYTSVLATPVTPDSVATKVGYYAATAVTQATVDTSLPIQLLTTPMLPPATRSLYFTQSARNTLFNNGLSICKTTDAGQVILERCRTTYQTNTAGTPDTSYRDLETMFQIMEVVQTYQNTFNSKYFANGGFKLVDNATQISAGSRAINTNTLLAEAIAIYNVLSAQGKVQNPSVFAQSVYATSTDGAVSLYLPVQIANQLRQVQIAVAFSKP